MIKKEDVYLVSVRNLDDTQFVMHSSNSTEAGLQVADMLGVDKGEFIQLKVISFEDSLVNNFDNSVELFVRLSQDPRCKYDVMQVGKGGALNKKFGANHTAEILKFKKKSGKNETVH